MRLRGAIGLTGLICPVAIVAAGDPGVEPEFTKLFSGTTSAAIVGLVLGRGPEPTVYFRKGGGAVQESPTVIGIRPDEILALSQDWTRGVRTTFEEELTKPELVQDSARLPIDWTLTVGATSILAWSRADPPDDQRPRAWILRPGSERELSLPRSPILWASLAIDEAHVALGLRDSTVVFGSAGTEVARFPMAELGQLSPTGEWLALSHALEDVHLLELIRPSSGSAIYLRTEPVDGLVFDPTGSLLCVVSRRVIRVLDLKQGQAREARALLAPPDQEWRSAIFDRQGRLAVGAIRDVQRARRPGREPNRPPVAASATIVVQVYAPALDQPPVEARLNAGDWNAESPEIAFDPQGRLFTVVWPSAFEVKQ
jgi:hypothetical protein